MNQQLIGLTGNPGAGKDTVADYLEDSGYQTLKESFADPIYDIVKIAFCLTEEYVRDRANKERKIPGFEITLRQALQLIGTEMFRDMIDQDFWLKNMDRRREGFGIEILAENLPPAESIVIPDVRFPNEAIYVKKAGGTIGRIVQDGCDGEVGFKDHRSESHSIQADIEIENNGTKEELYAEVDRRLRSDGK